tara:strand:- start:27 stop:218 length:192 start_codon:yes stop_codon:yes gene_type:complete
MIIKKEKNKKSGLIFSEKKENKKTFIEPIIDDREEYFVKNKINNQEIQKTKARLKEKANIIPK